MRDAQQALRSHREGQPTEFDADFTVTALTGGRHTVVYDGRADESGYESDESANVVGSGPVDESGYESDESANVVGSGPGLRIEFDSRQRWTSREYLLGEAPWSMAGLWAVADRTWGPGDEENGAGRITYRLTGADAGAVARFAVHTVPPESAEYVHGPFVATDHGYGHRYHFGPEGTFTARDTPLQGGWAYLRTEVGAPGGAPRLLDPQGVTWEDWQAGKRGVDGLIEVRPADDGGAPHQRMLFHSVNGRLYYESVPLRDHEGQLVGYAEVAHHLHEGRPLVSRPLDVNGNVEQGHPLTVTGQPGGGLVVEDGTGRVLFRRFAWGTAPGTNQSTPQTEPPRGTIARPFLEDSHGDVRQVRPGEAVLGGGAAVLGRGAQELRIHAPWGPGLQLRDAGRPVPGQFVRDGDRFVFLRPLSAEPDGPMREYRLDARWQVESESLILGGPYTDPRIPKLRVALQERPGGGRERVLLGPEEYRQAFRLEIRAGGGHALVETATGIRHIYRSRGKALYREVPLGSSHRHYLRISAENPSYDLRVVRATDPVNAPSSAALGPAEPLSGHRVVVSPVDAEFSLTTLEDGLRLRMPRVVVDTRDGRILEEVLRAEGEGPAAYWQVDHLTRQAVALDADGQEVLGEGGASLRPVLETGADTPGLRFVDEAGNVVLDRTGPNPLDAWAPAAGSDDPVSEPGSVADLLGVVDLLGFGPQEVALVDGGVQVGRSYYAYGNASTSSLPLHAHAAYYVERLARTEDGRLEESGSSWVPWGGESDPVLRGTRRRRPALPDPRRCRRGTRIRPGRGGKGRRGDRRRP